MKTNNMIEIDILSLISDLDITKEQKEHLALSLMKSDKDKAEVVWENDKITAIRLLDSIKSVSLIIDLNEGGLVNE